MNHEPNILHQALLAERVKAIQAKLNPKTIYVVSGDCGEYENRYLWDAQAFDTWEAAEEFANLLNEFYRDHVLAHSENTRSEEYELGFAAMQELDPGFQDYSSSDPDCQPSYAVGEGSLTYAVEPGSTA